VPRCPNTSWASDGTNATARRRDPLTGQASCRAHGGRSSVVGQVL
jgi:hypothetical protein